MSTNGLSIRVKGSKVQHLRRIELTFSRSKIRRVTNRKPGNPLTCDLKVGKLWRLGQMVKMSPCHGVRSGFDSRNLRQSVLLKY